MGWEEEEYVENLRFRGWPLPESVWPSARQDLLHDALMVVATKGRMFKTVPRPRGRAIIERDLQQERLHKDHKDRLNKE